MTETVAQGVMSAVYPVAGGVAAGLTTRGLLEGCRRFVVGSGSTSRTPPGRGSGRAAQVWTALSWAVSLGVGIYAGRKLVREPLPTGSREIQPAQS